MEGETHNELQHKACMGVGEKIIEQLNTCMGVGPDGGLLPTLI